MILCNYTHPKPSNIFNNIDSKGILTWVPQESIMIINGLLDSQEYISLHHDN